jgi:structural maintenance of chromosome 3 (chondroitin sulfate proteoglycan 6)
LPSSVSARIVKQRIFVCYLGENVSLTIYHIYLYPGCDPAPFYLFDELDQALDSNYRAAVERVIQRQANNKDNPTQFIVSTFRQELVAVANRCYGISHQNKVSSVYHMPKQDAQKFIANLNSEEEAIGEVTSLAVSKASRLTRDSRKRKPVDKSDDEAEKTDDEGEGSETSEVLGDDDDE